MRLEFFDRQDELSPLNGTIITQTSELLTLLARFERRAPFFFELLGQNGYKILVGIGDLGGCVQYSETTGEPPYFMAISNDVPISESHIDFLMGGTLTPIPCRYFLPLQVVHEIAGYFHETGERYPMIIWEEV
jgi:hypothetical protein